MSETQPRVWRCEKCGELLANVAENGDVSPTQHCQVQCWTTTKIIVRCATCREATPWVMAADRRRRPKKVGKPKGVILLGTLAARQHVESVA